MLAPRVELSRIPNSSPHLHETITQVIDDEVQEIERSSVPDIELLLKDYLRSEWNPWAKDETPKRLEINRCERLFSIFQTLNSGLDSESRKELCIGIGVSLWKVPDGELRYPLITQNVDLQIDKTRHQQIIRELEARRP